MIKMDKTQGTIGLSSEEAAERLKHYGHNQLPEKQSDSLFHIFIYQFNSPFIYVLFAAALVSFGLSQNLNGIFIFAVLLLNASIGTIQEYSAQRAAETEARSSSLLHMACRFGYCASTIQLRSQPSG